MKSLQGHLLIASPELLDPNFHQAVVLLVQHGEDGAMGLVLNRPTHMALCDAWEQVSQTPCRSKERILRGGPCEGPLMVIHTVSAASQLQIMPDLYFSTDESKIEQLVELNASPARFFVGYAGWSPGQLEEELKSDSWLITPATPDHIFGNMEDLWERLHHRLVRRSDIPFVNPRLMPRDPTMN